MPKSNYPNKLDTSAEIPVVRDNITEIGSDTINSIRSAILQIEATLGINPHGATGNTVASRLSNVIDSNGNILKSALDRANVLSGPITDNDISKSASISETKLNLNFPTKLLQAEISQIINDLNIITSAQNELSAQFSTHINDSALNRHKAKAISVTAHNIDASDEATQSLESETLQAALERIYDAHIGYSGASVSSSNNSHTASQIYFDNQDIQDVVTQDSVQGAIEDIADASINGLRNSLLLLSSNGRIRSGKLKDAYEENSKGTVLVESSGVTYIQAEGESRTTFTFSSSPDIIDSISKYDILTLSGSSSDDDNKDYQIDTYTSSSGSLLTVTVFGGPLKESASGLTAVIYKNQHKVSNPNGLNATVRPRNNRTNTPDIQIANLNAATIVTSGLQPSKITSTAHKFNISIDGGSAVTISTYDSNVAVQTIDSIVNKINEQCVDNHLNFMAYKIKVEQCYEVAFTHTVPNIANDFVNRTLKLSAASTDDGSSILGMSTLLGITYEGDSGNSYIINGSILNTFGLIKTFDYEQIEIITGSLTIGLFSGSFFENGIRIGDLVIISGSTNSNDDGTYRIKNILESTIELDLDSTFAGALDEDSVVHIIRCTAPVDELSFEESVSNNGAILFDIFITEDSDVHYSKRLEIDSALQDDNLVAAVIDVSKNFIIKDQTATISVSTAGYATLTGPDLVAGEPVLISNTGIYNLYSSNGLSFVTIAVNATGTPTAQRTITLYGFSEVSRNNYRVCRGLFSTSLGRVLGYPQSSGVPVLVDKRRSGTVDETIVSESLIEKYIEGPRNELRASGIIRGCSVTNAQSFSGYQTVNISAGIVVINGIRREISSVTGFRVNTDDDFYLAIDAYGCIISGEAITNPDGATTAGVTSISPFTGQTVAYLAFVSDGTVTDLRLFVDHIDYKFTNQIIVSPKQHFGHFTSIKSAVDYAGRFTEMFPTLGTPTVYVAEGEFSIPEKITINFDLNLKGSGPATIIKKSGSLAIGSQPSSGNINLNSAAFLIGDVDTPTSSRIVNGVSFSDFTYQTSDDLDYVGIAVTVAHSIATSDAIFRFTNVNFIGTESLTYSASDSAIKGEYAVAVGSANETTYAPIAGTFGNIIITGCRFHAIGTEKGAVKLASTGSSTFTRIVATSNIATYMSPIQANTTFEIVEIPASGTLTNIIESSNVVALS